MCHSMDRLARNLDDLRRIVTELTKRGVNLEFVKESLAFTGADSPMGAVANRFQNHAMPFSSKKLGFKDNCSDN